MRRFSWWPSILGVTSAVAFLLGCAQSNPSARNDAGSGEMLRVHITANGVVTADGREVSLDELEPELARLAASGGSVLYTRDNPRADPHPNAMKVLQAIIDAKVRLLMPDR